MKIAIFENEYESVRGTFNTANQINFDGNLDISLYSSSQNANLERINDFDAIFIDISLGARSDLDGFALIQKIQSINEKIVSKIIILTGNNKIGEILASKKIDQTKIQIIIKPSDYEEITNAIKNIKK